MDRIGIIPSPDNCPHCGVSLQGDPIPPESQHLYGATHYRNEIGHEVPGIYDGVLFWSCPECGGRWHRWSGDMGRRAEQFVQRCDG